MSDGAAPPAPPLGLSARPRGGSPRRVTHAVSVSPGRPPAGGTGPAAAAANLGHYCLAAARVRFARHVPSWFAWAPAAHATGEKIATGGDVWLRVADQQV